MSRCPLLVAEQQQPRLSYTKQVLNNTRRLLTEPDILQLQGAIASLQEMGAPQNIITAQA